MGLNYTHALGRNQKFYAKAESTAGTFAKPAGTDAMKVLKSSFPFTYERIPRMDARSTRSTLEQITRRMAVKWALEKYVIPSGSAGTAPDDGELLKAAFGTETVNASTSVVYSLSDTQTLRTVSLVREFNAVLSEAIAGACVNSVKLSMSGGDVPKLSYEGFGWTMAHTGVAVLNGAVAGGASTFTTTAATNRNITVGSVVSLGSDTNSGAGYQVTAVNTSTYVCTFTPVAVTGASDGASVAPYVPTETTSGNPAAGIDGAITVGGASLPLTAFEVTLSNAVKEINDEANQQTTTDYIPGIREITGKVTVRARQDQIIRIGRSRAFATEAISAACGTTAGKILTVSIPYAEIIVPSVEVPESEEGTFELAFKALGSSGADDMTWTFT